MRLRAPDKRFCISCGSKPFKLNECEEDGIQEFLATFRYQCGDRWTVSGVEFVKEFCSWCKYTRAMLGVPDPLEESEKYGRRICWECLPYIRNGRKKEEVERKWRSSVPEKAQAQVFVFARKNGNEDEGRRGCERCAKHAQLCDWVCC